MKISIETLYHFQCSSCNKWWSIGDAEPNKDKWWCPWCGHEHISDQIDYFDIENGTEIDEEFISIVYKGLRNINVKETEKDKDY